MFLKFSQISKLYKIRKIVSESVSGNVKSEKTKKITFRCDFFLFYVQILKWNSIAIEKIFYKDGFSKTTLRKIHHKTYEKIPKLIAINIRQKHTKK